MDNALVREWDDQHDYDVHRSITKSVGLTSREYIMAFVFDPLAPWCTVVRNRFPYRGIKDSHWLVWIHPRYQSFWGAGRIPGGAWENVEADKSIPEIKHYHTVSKPL